MNVEPKASVLIVDDQPSITRTVALILEYKGYAVTTAQNGIEAIEKARQQSFCSILMDVKMPHMDGVEAFRQIKQIRPQATVVMMTAYAVDDLIQQALDEGARGVLYKPVDVDRLLEMLDRAATGQDEGEGG